MMMGLRGCSDVLNLGSLEDQLMFEVTNVCLAPFYLSHLLNVVPTVHLKVPSFGTMMFKFALWISVSWQMSIKSQ